MTVADTDVLIDFLAGKGEADAVERLIGQGVLGTTTITASSFSVERGRQGN